MKLELLPAVDVKNGQAVRLSQGKLSSEINYGSPLAVAIDFQKAGAEWIHLVDLDSAFGIGNNTEILASVISKLDINVELSGGIRDDDSLSFALKTGCRRINLSTNALDNPEWVAKAIGQHGDRIAVALDIRGSKLEARGSTKDEKAGADLFETLVWLDQAGCARYVVTDVSKDGTLAGPNIELLKMVCAATNKPIIASGGISSLSDLLALKELVEIGIEGAIVGKALYSGAFTFSQAFAVANQ